MFATCVFLSYSRKNSNYARTLHDRLEASQVTVWWDQEEVPGSDWTEQLLIWLETAQAVIVVVDQHSVTAPSVKNEILLAQDYQRRVIPVLLEQARGGLWVLIRSLQWIDARENRDPVPDLLEALQVNQRTAQSLIDDTSCLDNQAHQLLPPPAGMTRAQITITLPGDSSDFDDHEQLSLIHIIARFAKLQPEQIRIVRVESGSIHVTLELPESSACWLMTMYDQQTSVVDLLDIQSIRDLHVLPTAHGTGAKLSVIGQLAAWFQNRTRARALALTGTFVAVLLVIILFNILQMPSHPTDTPVAIVTEVQGTLEMQRADWDVFTPISVGTKLENGDRLQLNAGAQASVVCTDGTRIELQPGIREILCSPDTNELLFNIDQAQWANTVLSTGNNDVPQIITPRATLLLTTTPTIRWTAVDGAETYTVKLRREGEDVWSETVENATTLSYPVDQSPLEVGPIYRFVITADNGSEEVAQGIGTQVLDIPQAQMVEMAIRQIDQIEADESTTRILLANVYAKHGLYAATLELLTPSFDTADTMHQSTEFQLLGNVYVAIGLPNLAIGPYIQALDIAEVSNNRLGQAQANQMLGTVYSRLGGENNRTQAIKHYHQALQFYQEVGDTNAQTELRQRIADLE
ncbi:MAG: toll/interleukin-1 receptor domain-containing protein [Chloroflexota bacterium]